jgi:TonB family protein
LDKALSRLNLFLSILISCLALNVKAEEVSSRIWTNYVDTVQQSIAEKWKPKGFLQSYYTMVVFEVNPDGSLRRIELDKSSGNKSFDAFALDTVKLAAPFNALPVATKPIKIKYFFDFEYKTEDFILDSGTVRD